MQSRLEKELNEIKKLTAEIRSYQKYMGDLLWHAEKRSGTNKTQGKTAIQLLALIAAGLGCILVGFPLLYWWINTWRITKLAGVSEELAGTMVIIQERQTELGQALRELEEEMEYLPISSTPHLKKLWEQAKESMIETTDRLEFINKSLKSSDKLKS